MRRGSEGPRVGSCTACTRMRHGGTGGVRGTCTTPKLQGFSPLSGGGRRERLCTLCSCQFGISIAKRSKRCHVSPGCAREVRMCHVMVRRTYCALCVPCMAPNASPRLSAWLAMRPVHTACTHVHTPSAHTHTSRAVLHCTIKHLSRPLPVSLCRGHFGLPSRRAPCFTYDAGKPPALGRTSLHGLTITRLLALPIRITYRRVGGLRFVALGRVTFSWSVSRVPDEA